MIRFAADENFNGDIIRGLRRRRPDVDVVTVQEAGLSGTRDPSVLEWAAGEGRILLTHDVSTITQAAFDRVRAGQPMPGVFEAARGVPTGRLIEDIVLIAECRLPAEWDGRVIYLPL